MGLVLSAAYARGWTTGLGMERPSVPAGAGEGSSTGRRISTFPWSLFTKLPHRRMRVAFTCNVCGQRTTRVINPHAYIFFLFPFPKKIEKKKGHWMKISNLEMELATARDERVSLLNDSPILGKMKTVESTRKRKYLMVIGISTTFSSRKRKDSVRATWMPQGDKRKRLEEEKGIVIRFVIGHRLETS